MRLTLPPALLPATAGAALLIALAAPTAVAQTLGDNAAMAPPPVRITAQIDNDALVPLKGNTDPLAQPVYDRGPVSPSRGAGKMELLLQRDPARQTALHRYLDSLQDPHSPSYHKWLTPTQYGAQFGIGETDLQTVETWLASEGFKIEAVPPSRNLIEFSGTIGQVEQAFHTGIHTYAVNGSEHRSNVSDPQTPAALAPVVAGLSPLNDFRATAQHVLGGRSQVRHTAGGSLEVLPGKLRGATPLLADTTQTTLFVTPANAATIYDSPNSFNKAYSGGTQETGSGVSIGIAGYSDLATADYLNYRKLFLNEASPAQPTLVVDGVDPGVLDQFDGQETLIDAEVAAAMAPGATIYVYSSASNLMDDGLTDAILRAIEDNNVSVLNVSYSRCEASLGTSGNMEFYEMWQEAAAQGISVVVATGDTGTAACDDKTQSAAMDGLAVNGYASTPYNVAVGGTDFDILGTEFSQYVSSGNNVDTAPSQASVSGYIPENPWNDSISNDPPGSYATDNATTYNNGMGPQSIILAGGGGVSSIAGYQAPFQSGISIGAAGPANMRYLPDVSLFAGANRQYPANWALCSDNLVGQADFTFTDCVPGSDGTFSVEGAGGTATATAAFSGVLGVVLQSLGGNTRIGAADNVLYNLYANAGKRAAIFHDVTAGNNAVPCAAGSPQCGGNGFLTGYDAGTGYDLATGLGSVDISALAAAWPTVTFTPTTTALLVDGAVTPLTIKHGTPVTLAATVTPSTVTGTVSVSGLKGQAGAAASEYIPLNSGAGSTSADNLPGGSYTVTGYYPGDVTDSPSTSAPPIQITVTPEDSALQLTLQVTDVNTSQADGNSFPYGSFGFVYAQPTNADIATAGADGTATGTVTLLNNGASLNTQALNSRGNAAFPVDDLAPGSYLLGATYSGDQSFNPSSTASTTTVTVAKGPTTLAAALAAPSIDISASATVTVTLGTDSTGMFPTGEITLMANGKSFPGTVTQVRTPINSDEEIATFTVAGSALTTGANTLTAAYSGDANYLASNATAVLTVTGMLPVPGFTLAGPAGGITVKSPATSASGIVTVTPTNGFTGAINLTCSLAPATTATAASPPTCAVTPSVTIAGTTAANATLTITTGSAVGTQTVANNGGEAMRRLLEGSGALTLCSALLLLTPSRRRRWRSLLMVLLACGLLGAVGCGVTRYGGLPVTYTATVTGTSGGTVATNQVAVTVP